MISFTGYGFLTSLNELPRSKLRGINKGKHPINAASCEELHPFKGIKLQPILDLRIEYGQAPSPEVN